MMMLIGIVGAQLRAAWFLGSKQVLQTVLISLKIRGQSKILVSQG